MAENAKTTGAAPKAAPQTTTTPTEGEDKPKRDTFRAESFLDLAVAEIKRAGEAGLSVKDLGVAIKAKIKADTGREIADTHAYRIAHNVGWTLEGKPVYRAGDEQHTAVTRPDKRQVHRLPGSAIRYVMGKGKVGTEAAYAQGQCDYWLTKEADKAQRSAA